MNLTKTSEMTRKAIVGGIALIFLIFVIKILIIPMVIQMISLVTPDKDPPNPIFGVLDAPTFEQSKILNQAPEYALDTKTGKLPTDLPDKMTVYRMEAPVFSYEAGKNASSTALYLGFSDTDLTTDLKGDVYGWRDTSLVRQLTIQINTKDLDLTTDMYNKSSHFIVRKPFEETGVKGMALSFLNQTGRGLDTLYSGGTQKITYGKIAGQKIVDSESATGAQVAKIDFFRSINNIPIYGPNLSKGLISVVVGNTENPKLKIVSSNIRSHGISSQSNATYPIVPVEKVWEAVRKNLGVIASVDPNEQSAFENYVPVRVEKVNITEVSLAYYENTTQQKYLQPMYVFKGFYTSSNSKGSIAVYYPAITGEYIRSSEPTPTE